MTKLTELGISKVLSIFGSSVKDPGYHSFADIYENKNAYAIIEHNWCGGSKSSTKSKVSDGVKSLKEAGFQIKKYKIIEFDESGGVYTKIWWKLKVLQS